MQRAFSPRLVGAASRLAFSASPSSFVTRALVSRGFSATAASPPPPAAENDQLLEDAGRKVHFRASTLPHPLFTKPARLQAPVQEIEWENPIHHEIWSQEEVNSVERTHIPPADFIDNLALNGVRLLRLGFDVFSGYAFGSVTTPKLLRRIVFLETVAGIPGMVAGSLRHLRSLRLMRRDHGWIHTLLEEAENERMHLLVFKDIKKPSLLLRSFVMASQGVYWNVFFLAYILSPRLCHRFVGYIEEEAVRTYTKAIEAYDAGLLPELRDMEVPSIARTYWRLQPNATMRDVLLAVRADEANHRDVNHTFSKLQTEETNPFVLKQHQ